MQKIKTYDKHGQFIDTVVPPEGVRKETLIMALNSQGRYVRRQFNDRMKLTHQYQQALFPVNKLKASIAQPVREIVDQMFNKK